MGDREVSEQETIRESNDLEKKSEPSICKVPSPGHKESTPKKINHEIDSPLASPVKYETPIPSPIALSLSIDSPVLDPSSLECGNSSPITSPVDWIRSEDTASTTTTNQDDFDDVDVVLQFIKNTPQKELRQTMMDFIKTPKKFLDQHAMKYRNFSLRLEDVFQFEWKEKRT